MLANQNGYSLLWVVPKVDAFFIRNDLVDDGTKEWVFPCSFWRRATNLRVHPKVRDCDRLRVLTEATTTDNTNVVKDLMDKNAFMVGKKFLVGNGDLETWVNRLRMFCLKFLKY